MPANTLILLAASLGATPAAPTCTPPTYAQVSPPKYPPSAVAERLEGTAVLRMLVGADGTVKELGFEHSTGHVVLDDAVISAAGRSTFNPARCDGKPVENWVLHPFRFNLDELTPEEIAAAAPTPEEIAAAAPAPQASSNPAAAPLIFPRVRQLQHVVEPDTQSMEFSTFYDGEKNARRDGVGQARIAWDHDVLRSEGSVARLDRPSCDIHVEQGDRAPADHQRKRLESDAPVCRSVRRLRHLVPAAAGRHRGGFTRQSAAHAAHAAAVALNEGVSIHRISRIAFAACLAMSSATACSAPT